MSDLGKIKEPILVGQDKKVVDDNAIGGSLVDDLAMFGDSGADYYFKVAPPEEGTIRLKSSVVIKLPLYTQDSIEKNEVYSSKQAGGPISFEEFYTNYDAEDFAQYLVGSGMIAKSIRYALLYNYFGYPAANIQISSFDDPDNPYYELSKTFGTLWGYERQHERVPHNGGDGGGNTYGNFYTYYTGEDFGDLSSVGISTSFIKKGGTFVDFLQGMYQLGGLGSLPSFQPTDVVPQNDNYKTYLTDFAVELNPGDNYIPYVEFFGALHGSAGLYEMTFADTGGSSYVEPIGIRARHTGFLAYNPSSQDQLDSLVNNIPKSEILSLDLNSNFHAELNPLGKTYARAFYPAFQSEFTPLLVMGDQILDGTPSYSETIPFDGYTPEYQTIPGTPNTGASMSHNWKNSTTYIDDINSPKRNVNALNSLALTLGSYDDNLSFAHSWYQYATEPAAPNSRNFSLENIASMYKLVPSDLSPGSLGVYLQDPSKTLNKVFPKIFKYVRDITPLQMIQQNINSDKMKELYPDYVENGSELNSSDIIVSGQLATPESFLRKFRIGHELQQQLYSYEADGTIINTPENSTKYNTLGFTHTIGTFDHTKGTAFYEIIKGADDVYPQNQWVKYYRNKISFVFKTWWHESFFLNPANSVATTGIPIPDHAGEEETLLSPLFISEEGGADFSTLHFVPENFFKEYNTYLSPKALNEIEKTYLLSSKILNYLYIKKPSGFDSYTIKNDPFNPTKPENEHYYYTYAFDFDTFDEGIAVDGQLNGFPMAPTTLNFSDSIQLAKQLKGFKFLNWYDSETYNVAKKALGSENDNFDIPDMAEGSNSLATNIEFVNKLVAMNQNTQGSSNQIGFGSENTGDVNPDMYVQSESQFCMPIWKYQQGSSQDLKNIQWPLLKDSEAKSAALSSVFKEQPSSQAFRNYGIPDWVTSLRIYPSLDQETKVTNRMNSPVSPTDTEFLFGNPAINNDFIGFDEESPGKYLLDADYAKNSLCYTNDPEYGLRQCSSAAIKVVVEPAQDYQGLSTSMFFRHAEIRYVTEIDIDERKLIMDLVSQGVFSFAGTEEEYVNAGFDITELISKSNGNLISPDLKEMYETGDYDFGAGFGADYSDFPGLFGTTQDEFCVEFPPEDVVNKVEQVLAENPDDPYACTSYICLADIGAQTIALKEQPGPTAANLGYLSDRTIVKVLKEWVNGKGEYDRVLIVDPTSALNGIIGFISPKYLKPVSPRQGADYLIFFEQYFQSPKVLRKTQVSKMSEMSLALVPTWWSTEEPYYHTEDGEHWITVELPYTCVNSKEELNAMYDEAKVIGVKSLFDFYDKSYTEDDVAKIISSYLAVKAVDHHVPLRPNSKVKILVKVGGIYLEAFPSSLHDLQVLKDKSSHVLSLDLRYFQTHLDQAVFSLNKIYLDVFSSDFYVDGFNFSEEARRLSYVPSALKKILLLNGYEYNKDPNKFTVVNVGFNSDFSEIVFMSVVPDGNQPDSDASQERILNIGFQFYRDLEPLNIPRTMALLNYHREIKNPTLKWQTIFEEWLPNPKPAVIPKSIAVKNNQYSDTPGQKCGYSFQWPAWGDILMGIAERLDASLDLNPRYDLGAFQFNLLQFFPPCPKPPPGSGTAFFKFLSEIDGQTTVAQNGDFIDAVVGEANRTVQYVGDFLSSGAALKDLKTKIFDLDDLYAYVLNYITPEVLYSKICKCFISVMDDQFGIGEIGIPNLEMGLSGGSGGLNLSPSTIMNNPSEIVQNEPWSFNNNIIDADGNVKPKDQLLETLKTEDLLCSFCFNIPALFFRLPTSDILSSLIDLIKKLLEFALSQILLELISALLDILLTCPELECSNESPSVRDYGAQDIPELLNSYAGQSKDYSYCGINVGEGPNDVSVETVEKFLSEASQIMTTNEIAALLDGSSPRSILKSIKDISDGYPQMELNSITGIADFFSCLGSQLNNEAFDYLESAGLEKYEDPLVCSNIIEDNKAKLLEKCGELSPDDLQDILKKNLTNELDKYKEIAKIIRDNDDLSSQLPPLFSDGKGEKALLAGIEFETATQALEETLETMFSTVQSSLYNETLAFFSPRRNLLIKESPDAAAFNAGTVGLIISTLGLGGEGGLFSNGIQHDKFAGIPNTVAGELDVNAQKPLDEILAELPASVDLSQALTSNILATYIPGTSGYIYLELSPPSLDTETNEPIYSDKYKFQIRKPVFSKVQGDLVDENQNYELSYIDQEFYNETDINESLKEHLQGFPLEVNMSPVRPEQSQYFSNILLSGIGLGEINTAEDADIPEGQKATFSEFKKMLQGEIYYGILSSLFSSMARKVSDTNLAKDYKINIIDTIDSEFIKGTVEAFISATPLIEKSSFPSISKKQIQNLKLVQTGKATSQNKLQRTFVDFQYATQLSKRAYDFSIKYDPNSPTLGMPHMAMLEGVISSMMQTFCGELATKSIFLTPLFPLEAIATEPAANFVLENFKRYLEKDNNFKWKWYAIVTRMVAEKPEFTPSDPNAQPPGLPGEFGAPSPGTIDGEIYDTTLGRTFKIENWEDATLYYIRKNIERPIKFIKNRLKETAKLSGGLSIDSVINPNDFISYPIMKEVHRATFFTYADTSPAGTTSLIKDGNQYCLDEFKNGKFFYQFYFRFEDFSPEEEGYNEYVSGRKVIVYNPEAGDFAPWVPPMPDEVDDQDAENELPENPFGSPDWLLEALGEDVENPVLNSVPYGSQPGDPINELSMVAQGTDYSLKSVINTYSVDRLWNYMANPIDNAYLNYALTPEEQEKPFESFFKSIKIGVRLCYGVGHTDETITLEDGSVISVMEPASGLTDVPYNKFYEQLQTTLKQSISAMTISNPEFGAKIQEEKSCVVQEISTVNAGDGILDNEKYPVHTSFVFPILSHEIDVTNMEATPFDIPVSKYHEFSEPGNLSIIQRVHDFANTGKGNELRQECLKKIYEKPEFMGLFGFSLPIDKLVSMLMFYTYLSTESDPNTSNHFDSTKDLIKQQIESIYEIRGPSGVAYQPKYLKDKGGPSNLALSNPEE